MLLCQAESTPRFTRKQKTTERKKKKIKQRKIEKDLEKKEAKVQGEMLFASFIQITAPHSNTL